MAGRGNGRGNNQMADAIATLTNIVARDHQPGREDEMRLERFMKHNPKLFTGGYAREAAVKWIEEVEIVFEAMRCTEENKLTLGTYVLREEANKWWRNAKLRMGVGGVHLIGFSQIRDFATLVDKCCICDDDGKAKTNYYKAMSDKRGRGQDRGKSYGDKGKKVAETNGGKKNGGGQCYKCGEMGHKSYECLKKVDKCFNCGRLGHKSDVCQVKVTCFNCGEEGHKSSMCKKPKKTIGKVFALSGDDADQVDNLIRVDRNISASQNIWVLLKDDIA
ncbi:DNA-binding protein HEXBP-like [Trifolium pratense]|nr:DNA-binding protein HEXBP-like [Trifolium pratense]